MILVALPVPAGIGYQGVNVGVPVGHASEGLGHQDTAGKDIPAFEVFMQE